MSFRVGHRVFDSGCSMLEVTSLSRPNTNWLFIDAYGHEHRWYDGLEPATSYRPEVEYTTPTLVRVLDKTEYDEDGEPFYIYRWDCVECHETITRGFIGDDCRQFIPGIRWYQIDGRHVSPEEFKRELDLEES